MVTNQQHPTPVTSTSTSTSIQTLELVFTVTAGRSGTSLLTKLLELVPGIIAKHEHKPSFVTVMRKAQKNPQLATKFLHDTKLPRILQQTSNATAAFNDSHKDDDNQNNNDNKRQAATMTITHYVETSHLFCKGFVEPLRDILLQSTHHHQSQSCVESGCHYQLPKIFSLIVLRRHPSCIAQSLWERDSIPGRSRFGKPYLLHPGDDNVLGNPALTKTSINHNHDSNHENIHITKPNQEWNEWSDYQLCYWYALEIERRQIIYTQMAIEQGWKHHTITLEELTDFDSFCGMCRSLGIPLPTPTTINNNNNNNNGSANAWSLFQDRFQQVATTRHNPNTNNKDRMELRNREEEEQEIWEWIQTTSPDMASALSAYQLPPPPPPLRWLWSTVLNCYDCIESSTYLYTSTNRFFRKGLFVWWFLFLEAAR